MPIFMALLALAPAMLTSEKGGKPLNWFCYGFMLWIVAIIHAAIIPANPENAPAMKRQFWQGVRIGAIVHRDRWAKVFKADRKSIFLIRTRLPSLTLKPLLCKTFRV